jgi:glutathione S-transferase
MLQRSPADGLPERADRHTIPTDVGHARFCIWSQVMSQGQVELLQFPYSHFNEKAAFEATEAALALVAKRSRETGYLVGDAFSIADLCAAALLAPSANPGDSPMEQPLPRPAKLASWLMRWNDHPGVAWVREMYRAHRSPDQNPLTHSPGGARPPMRAR